jgi:hypothetical protein
MIRGVLTLVPLAEPSPAFHLPRTLVSEGFRVRGENPRTLLNFPFSGARKLWRCEISQRTPDRD